MAKTNTIPGYEITESTNQLQLQLQKRCSKIPEGQSKSLLDIHSKVVGLSTRHLWQLLYGCMLMQWWLALLGLHHDCCRTVWVCTFMTM